MFACRLVNTSDLSSLPVVHHTRLFRAPVVHVGFSCCGTYLAAAAVDTGRVALLKLAAAGQHVQLLGYVKVEGAWVLTPKAVPYCSAGSRTRVMAAPVLCGGCDPWGLAAVLQTLACQAC